jgi:hypothetical protein
MSDNQLEKIGEAFGSEIVGLVRSNRAFTVTILDVDDTYAYVTMTGSDEKMTVPLTGMSITQSAFTIKPNIGSLAVVTLANGADNAPFFIAFSQIDSFAFKRGTTEFSWESAPTGRDDEGDELEGETEDVVNLAVGETTVKVDTNVWEFNGGELGGLTKTKELKTQLDKLTARVDGIINAITNGAPAPQDGGVVYQQTMVAILDTLTAVEDFSNLENEKITH